jgi:hypothetical protein
MQESNDFISIRDRFAMGAPPCPDWFRPTMPPEPQQERHPGGGIKYNKEIERTIKLWEKERLIQKTLQWPYAYAEMMVEKRNHRIANGQHADREERLEIAAKTALNWCLEDGPFRHSQHSTEALVKEVVPALESALYSR